MWPPRRNLLIEVDSGFQWLKSLDLNSESNVHSWTRASYFSLDQQEHSWPFHFPYQEPPVYAIWVNPAGKIFVPHWHAIAQSIDCDLLTCPDQWNCTKCVLICIYSNQSNLCNMENTFTWNRLMWELWIGRFSIKNQPLHCLHRAQFQFLRQAASSWFAKCYLNKVSPFPLQCLCCILFTMAWIFRFRRHSEYWTG